MPRAFAPIPSAAGHRELAEQSRNGLGRADAAAGNKALMEDIRLLGRILGDVIREQEGQAAFELIERVRQLSVAYRL